MQGVENLRDIALFIGVFIGGVITVLLGYKKPPAVKQPDPVIAGIGVELGSRIQIEELVDQVRRIADILEGKKTQGIETKLTDMIEAIDDLRRRQSDIEGMRAARGRPRRKAT